MSIVPTSPDAPAQPRSAQATGADGTRAPLPHASTHGAHSSSTPVDEPPAATGVLRVQHGAHAAGETDEHPHGRHTAG